MKIVKHILLASLIFFTGSQLLLAQSVNEREVKEDSLERFSGETKQLYNQYLEDVPDIEVATTKGMEPRLPRYVRGTYAEGIKGPKVRVLWPAPVDNALSSQQSQYTVTGRVPGTDFRPKAIITVDAAASPEAPQQMLVPFDLSQVTLESKPNGSETRFMIHRDKFIEPLARTNPDAFLYMFRDAFGQTQPNGAEPLRGWDSQETKLRGHATGHYMTAIAQAYASTGYNEELQHAFAEKMDYVVNTLYELAQLSGKPTEENGPFVAEPAAVPPRAGSEAFHSDLSRENIRTDYWNWGEGFISAYPPDQFIMLEKGAIYGREDNHIWAPYYTLHKILSGLLDIYEVGDNQKALDIAVGMGEWVHARLSLLSQDNLIQMWNRYIAGEYGGMNETMARLYRLTNNKAFLETARLFDNTRVFFGGPDHPHGLAKNVDMFRGLHANQHIPQIVGALENYRVSEEPSYYRVADNFWYKAVNDYMYSIGGVAGARDPYNPECFTAQPGMLYEKGLSVDGQNETCATYNLLKLTRNLFQFDPRGGLMDYYERGIYNHILASVAENSPANTYHVSLMPGARKRFGNPEMKGFSCCNGTALESSTKLQNSIYFTDPDNSTLYVNLFIPSTLQWSDDLRIEQSTSFPMSDRTVFTVRGSGTFDLKIRIPGWAEKGVSVSVNGSPEQVEAIPGTYVTLSRTWGDGDTVEVQVPMSFRLEPLMDQQNVASLFYGPVLLAAQESGPRTSWRKVRLQADDLSALISGDPAKLEFEIDGAVFKPFFDTYGHHSVYMDVELVMSDR